MGGESVRAFSSHGFLYVFIFIMEKKETVVYNERNKNNEVKLDDERKGRSMYLYKKEVRKFVKGRFIVGKGTMKRPLCMEKGYDKIETTKHPGFGRAEERDREKGCEGVGVLLEMREGG